MSLRVEGGRGASSSCLAGPSSTSRPCSITATRWAISATTPKSWVTNITPMPLSRCMRRISARICACVVTSSAVVGSSAISRLGSSANAMAITTRWRWPPDSRKGELWRRAGGSGRPTNSSNSNTRRSQARALSLRPLRCTRSTSAICSPTVINGLRADSGSWKTMAMSLPRSGSNAASSSCNRSRPWNRMRPPCAAMPGGSRPMMALALIDLPEPDSPTMHRISPRCSCSVMSATAWGRWAPGGRGMLNCSIDSSGGVGVGASCGIGLSYAPRWRSGGVGGGVRPAPARRDFRVKGSGGRGSGGFGVVFRPAPARRHFRITASGTRTATRAWVGRETKKASKLIGDSMHMAPGAVGATAPAGPVRLRRPAIGNRRGMAAPGHSLFFYINLVERLVQADGGGHPVLHVGAGERGELQFQQVDVGDLLRQQLLQLAVDPLALGRVERGAAALPERIGLRVAVTLHVGIGRTLDDVAAAVQALHAQRRIAELKGVIGADVKVPVARAGRPAAGIGGLDADLQPQALQHLPDIFIEPLPVGPIGQGQYLHRVAAHIHARFLDQCARLLQVELEHRRVALVEPGGGRERPGGRFALAEKNVFHHELAVQRMHHRLAHLQVVKRRLALVEHDVGQRRKQFPAPGRVVHAGDGAQP